MAEEAKKEEVKKDSTPESTKVIAEASPEAVAEAEANQKKAEEEATAAKAKEEAESKIDYKTELEKKTKELEQAQFLLKEKNIADKKKREQKKDGDEGDDDAGDDSKKSPDDVDQKLEQFKLDQLQGTISKHLETLSTDADERALIKLYFENVIKRSGDTEEAVKADLEIAQFLANKKRFEKLDEEMKAKKNSDENKNKGGGSGGHDIEGDSSKDTPNVSDADKQLLARYGLKPEDIKNN